MRSQLVLKLCLLCPALTRAVWRQYMRWVGWVPAGAKWLVLELERCLVPAQSVRTVSLGRGLRMEVDLTNPMGRDIYYHRGTEPELTAFLERFLKPGMVFVDAGANAGEVALIAAGLVGERGRVYAIEVSPNTLPRLRRNVALNRLSNVEVIEAALCDRDEPMSFYLGEGPDSGSSSLNKPHNYTGEMVTVPGLRLDTFAAARAPLRIDCIKMDVEGSELAALGGCERLLTGPHPPVVIFEYHQDVARRAGWTLAEVEALLRRCGYTAEPLTDPTSADLRTNFLARPAAGR